MRSNVGYWRKTALLLVKSLSLIFIFNSSNTAQGVEPFVDDPQYPYPRSTEIVADGSRCPKYTSFNPGSLHYCIIEDAIVENQSDYTTLCTNNNGRVRAFLGEKYARLLDRFGSANGRLDLALNIYYGVWTNPGERQWKKTYLATVYLCRTDDLPSRHFTVANPNRVFKAALTGASTHKLDCGLSVREAAYQLGYIIPKGLSANGIISYLRSNWRRVSMLEAMRLSREDGRFVIAGATSEAINKHKGFRSTTHGHVAVVSPYFPIRLIYDVEYPWVIGGAMDADQSSELSSDATARQLSSRRAFPKGMAKDNGVEYFTPR